MGETTELSLWGGSGGVDRRSRRLCAEEGQSGPLQKRDGGGNMGVKGRGG